MHLRADAHGRLDAVLRVVDRAVKVDAAAADELRESHGRVAERRGLASRTPNRTHETDAIAQHAAAPPSTVTYVPSRVFSMVPKQSVPPSPPLPALPPSTTPSPPLFVLDRVKLAAADSSRRAVSPPATRLWTRLAVRVSLTAAEKRPCAKDSPRLLCHLILLSTRSASSWGQTPGRTRVQYDVRSMITVVISQPRRIGPSRRPR